MRGKDPRVCGAVRGTIRSRLLVNVLVDPDEARRRLPSGLRPHVVGGGTIAGCCLLDVAAVRPAGLPAMAGTSFRAAAHRISVEWEDELGATIVGVHVPLRLTDSRAAIALGGHVFPGVHRRASLDLTDRDREISWCVEAGPDAGQCSVRVDASVRAGGGPPREAIGVTCLGAEIGLSPGHDRELEATRMATSHREAHSVEIRHLDSPFIAGFTSATAAPSYLMRDVNVTWTRARAAQRRRIEALT
jgi:hypothetical protein